MCTVHPGRSDQIKDVELGGACGTHGREEQHIQGFGGKTWSDCLEHLGVDTKTVTLASHKYVRWVKSKLKCTLVQALRLCTGRTAHRGSRGIALLFLDYGTRRGWGVSVTPRSLFTPGKDPVPIVQEAGWAPGSVWTGAENLVHTGTRSPDRPARSQSLYRLRYPAHNVRWEGVDYFSSSGQGQETGSCERGNEPWSSIKWGKYLD